MKETLMSSFDGKVKNILKKIVYYLLHIKSELMFFKKMFKTQEKISKPLEIFVNIFFILFYTFRTQFFIWLHYENYFADENKNMQLQLMKCGYISLAVIRKCQF